MTGLSPRVRGNPYRRASRRLPSRSIPACAGEPYISTPYIAILQVYPRVCGGTRVCARTGYPTRGLSPRVRGNRGVVRNATLWDGSIPACAGEPARLPRPQPLKRSIPACAGEPLPFAGYPRRGSVYPRVCGGTFAGYPQRQPRIGLSPRVRGNLLFAYTDKVAPGSIPACAGEPDCPLCGKGSRTVYPRVCGGTSSQSISATSPSGLSPRVRGNPRFGGGKHSPTRSIPACAGEPPSSLERWYGSEVYPRVCGGTNVNRVINIGQMGLSPRVRGNPARMIPSIAFSRSIPACAGEPTP